MGGYIHDASLSIATSTNGFSSRWIARPSRTWVSCIRCLVLVTSCPATHRGRTHGFRCGCCSCHYAMASRWTPREGPVATQACAMLRRLHWHSPTGPRIRMHAGLQCVTCVLWWPGLEILEQGARDRHPIAKLAITPSSCQPADACDAESLLSHAPGSVTQETSSDIPAVVHVNRADRLIPATLGRQPRAPWLCCSGAPSLPPCG